MKAGEGAARVTAGQEEMAAAALPRRSLAQVQLKAELASLPVRDQLAAIRPPKPLLPAPLSNSDNLAVQRQTEPMDQIEDLAGREEGAWAPFLADTITIGENSVNVYEIEAGRETDEYALIVGGQHGSEPAGVEVVSIILDGLVAGEIQPYYNVIIVPCLFPDKLELIEELEDATSGLEGEFEGDHDRLNEEETKDQLRETDVEGDGHGPIDHNRGLSTPGTDLEDSVLDGITVDGEGRPMLYGNVVLEQLVARYEPVRVANVHAISSDASAGFFADVRHRRWETEDGDEGFAIELEETREDMRLALTMAARLEEIRGSDESNEGNRGAEVPIYESDLEDYNTLAEEEGWPQFELADSHPDSDNFERFIKYFSLAKLRRTSAGAWLSTGTETRSSATTITVEIPEYNMSAGDEERREELVDIAATIEEIFLGPPE